MSDTTPSHALRECLRRADAAMKADDIETANAAMADGAAICLQLQETGLPLPSDDAESLRQLANACVNALVALSNRLNARSFRDDQHRRGILSYQHLPPR